MKYQGIDKWTLGYFLIKYVLAKPAHDFYYKRISLVNRNLIPDHEPVILVANHQNALMDAMALVCALNFQTVYLTRADVFRKKWIGDLLVYLKMLPIYRSRDGRENLGNNELIFTRSVEVLHNKRNPLGLFPEGNLGDMRRLRNISKGILRISFMAQEKFGNQKGIKIIPVGLNYDNYFNFDSELLILVGEPIEVNEFWDEYLKDQPTGHTLLRNKISAGLSSVMIDIQSEEHHYLYLDLLNWYRPEVLKNLKLKNQPLNRFKADKFFIGQLDTFRKNFPEDFNSLVTLYESYTAICNKLSIKDTHVKQFPLSKIRSIGEMLGGVVLLPVALYGYLNNLPLFLIPERMVKKLKDKQFTSTIKWGIALATYLLYYPILFILALIIWPAWWMALLYLVSLPLTLKGSVRIVDYIRDSWKKLKLSFLDKNHREIGEAKIHRSRIMNKLDDILKMVKEPVVPVME